MFRSGREEKGREKQKESHDTGDNFTGKGCQKRIGKGEGRRGKGSERKWKRTYKERRERRKKEKWKWKEY